MAPDLKRSTVCYINLNAATLKFKDRLGRTTTFPSKWWTPDSWFKKHVSMGRLTPLRYEDVCSNGFEGNMIPDNGVVETGIRGGFSGGRASSNRPGRTTSKRSYRPVYAASGDNSIAQMFQFVPQAPTFSNTAAVVCSWKRKSIDTVVSTLRSYGFSDVYVWGNEDGPIPKGTGYVVSSDNYASGIRWALACQLPHQWVYIQDDDLTLTKETIEALFRGAVRDRVVSTCGRVLQRPGWIFRHSEYVQGSRLTGPKPVDLCLFGAGSLATTETWRGAYAKYVELGRTNEVNLADDKAMSASLYLYNGKHPLVVPVPKPYMDICNDDKIAMYKREGMHGLKSEVLLWAAQKGWKPCQAGEVNIPMISGLCPTYGRVDNYLGKCIGMWEAQSYPRKKLYILNDAKVPIKYESDCVEVINHPERFQNLGFKRGHLLDLSPTNLVTHWDDDDIYFPWHLTQGVADLLAHPEKWCTRCKSCFVAAQTQGFNKEKTLLAKPNWALEAIMFFWKDRALEVGGYAPLDSGQALKLFNQFKSKSRLRFYYPWPTWSFIYVFKGDTTHISHVRDKSKLTKMSFGDGSPVKPVSAIDTWKAHWDSVMNLISGNRYARQEK